MPGGNQIRFGIGFDVNKAGLDELKKSLLEIQQLSKKDLLSNFGGNEQKTVDALKKAKAAARELDAILTKTFNSNLGTVNISRFQSELNKLGADGLNRIYSDLSSIGVQGTNAFNKLATSAMTTNVKLKQTFSILESMKTTLANTVKWTVASSAVNALTGSVSNAFNYVKALDASLTDIRIVTGQSREEMAQFAVQANEAAQALGRQTKEYTNAALTFYQQGLGEAEVQARTEATLKAQNVTGAGTEMADYLTAVWNGFRVSAENTELYVDKLAAVADSSASNLSELAIAMSKVASTANNLGVDIDQLAAQISTIVATTRQAPETVGNALKTIYARINDIKTGSDEAEISLGNYTGKMAKLGISVLDASGRLRDTGDVMEEIGSKWASMTKEQQIYLAQTMAGQRQMNNLIALFDNWQQYSEMLNVSLNAQGSLNEKNARYMDSISAHINQFKAATEGLQDTLIDENAVKGVIDAGTGLVNLFNDLLTAMGGMQGAGLALGGVLLNTFSSNIADGILKISQNLKDSRDNAAMLENELKNIREFQNSDVNGTSSQIASWASQANQFQQTGVISSEQRAELNQQMQNYNDLVGQKQAWEEAEVATLKYLQSLDNIGEKVKDIAKINVESKTEIEAAITEIDESLKNQEDIVLNLERNYKNLEAAKRNAEESQSDYSRARYETRQDRVKNDLFSNFDFFEKIAKAPSTFGFDEQSKLITELRSNLEGFEDDLLDEVPVETYAQRHIDMYRRITEAMRAQQQEAEEVVQQGVTNIGESIDTEISHIQESIQNTLEAAALKQEIQGILQALGGISGAIGGITSLVNAFKVLGNESLSTGEKVARFSQGLATSTVMLFTSISRVGSGLQNMRKGIIALSTAQKIANVTAEYDIALREIEDEGIKATVLELKKEEIQNIQTAATEKGINVLLKEQIALLWQNITAWAIKHKTLLLVVAAAAAFVAIGKLISSVLNAEADAAGRAAKRAEELGQRYRDIKQAYDELKSSLNDYKDSKKALDQMVVGTEEWKEALQEVNDQVLELINKYPELAQYVSNVNGELVLSEKGQAEFLRMQQDQVQRAQQINSLANNNARNAENKVVAQNLARSSSPFATVEDAERIIRAVSENSQILVDWAKMSDEDKSSANFATSSFYEQYANILGENAAIVRAILSNTDMLQSAIGTIGANTSANEANTDAIMSKVYEGNDQYIDSQYQDAVNKYTDQILQSAIQNQQNALVGPMTKEVLEEYAEIQGYRANSSKGARGGVTFLDENGERTELVSNEDIRAVVAYNRALNLLNDTAFQNEIISKIERVAQISPALLDFMNGAVGSLSSLSENEINDLLDKIKNNPVYEQLFADLGITYSNIEKAAREANGAVDDIINSIESGRIKAIIEELLPENRRGDISADNAKNLVNLITKLYRQGREGDITTFTDFFKGLNGSQFKEFFDLINNLDSDSTFASVAAQLEEMGIATDNLGGIINLILESFQKFDPTDFDSLAQGFSKAKGILDDLHYGDAISPEDFDYLEEFLGDKLDLSEFFKMTAEGNYQLIGSAKELRDAINGVDTAELVKGLAAAEQRIKELEPYEDVDLGTPLSLNDSNQKIAQFARAIAAMGGTETLSVEQALAMAEQAEAAGNKKIFDLADLKILNDAAAEVGSIETGLEDARKEAQLFTEALQNANLDADVDPEEFERMAEYLAEYGGAAYGISEDLKGNYEGAKVVAEALLRADAAAESVGNNIEKWSKALADPQSNIEEYLESLEEMDNAYQDLLNLSNDIHLSEEFLQSAENLDLMQKALNGSAEAYQQLQKNAAEDIIRQSITDNETGVGIPLNIDTEGLIEQIMPDIMNVQSQIADYLAMPGVEIGSAINDQAIIGKLEGIINAAGMTAAQATEFLSLMGVDATVVEGEPVKEASQYVAQAWSGPEYTTGTVEYGGPGFSGTFTYPVLDNEGTWIPKKAEGEETSPRPFALKITNPTLNANAGGNISHQKLGGNSGSRGKSGGGGKGGGSTKKKDPTKPFKSKIDPYHNVNIKIGNVQEGLTKLQKDRDKLIGKAAVDNLRKQIDMMEQQKVLLQEKAEIAKSELQRQAQELANLGAIFDANGDIANYNQLLLDKQNQINQAIEYGNTLQGDQRDAYDKYIKDLEQEYKDLETAIKDYDSTQQLLDDLELDYADIINEQIEKAVEAFDLEINLHLDLKDAQKEFNEFRKRIIDQIQDDEFGRLAEATARNYQNYYNVDENGVVGGIIPELRQHAQQIQKEIEIMVNGGWSNIYGDNLKLAAEDLKTYNDELMKNLEEAQDVIDETHEHLLDAIDSLTDAFDKQQEAFDKIDDFIQHDIELIQLVRGEEDYAALTGLWEQQVATDAQRLDKLRQQQEYWREQIDQYEEGTDEWETAMENWQNSFAALNEAMINAVKNLQSQWENSMNRILKDLGNSVYGGDQARALEEWENLNWHSDRYLDNLARANGLLNLQAEFTKAINATQDPKRQKELADLEQKQLDALSQKEHIREIDLKLAQQQLTVMQAQMALEDAQQSKTKMRLRRDSQGNYTYQYVADEDNITEKTQEYMNALEEYRNMAKEGLRDVLDEMNDVYSEWEDKVREAFEHFGSDTEAFKERIEVLQEDYFGEHGKMSLLAQEANDRISDTYVSGIAGATEMYNVLGETAMQKLLGPGGDSIISMVQQLIDSNGGEIPSLLSHFMVDTYEPFIESLDQKTHDQLFSTDGIFPEWGAAISGLAKDYVTGFVPDVVEAMNLLLESHQAYINGLGIIQEAAGRTFGQVAEGLNADTGYSYSLKTATDELVEAQKAQVEQANEVYNALKRNEEAFRDQAKAAIDAANAMFLYWLTLNGQTTSSLPYSFEGYTGVASNPSSSKASPNNYSSNSSSGGGGSGGSGAGGSGGSGSYGYTSSGGSGNSNFNRGGSSGHRVGINPGGMVITHYASGGYTGNWNSTEGRLAVLHQKELVLNEDDTKNILDAINITRAITNGVNSMALAALSHLSGGRKYSITDPTNESVLQNVVINADFPAVQDAAQIKQAFNELVNIASQRASKNRRAY